MEYVEPKCGFYGRYYNYMVFDMGYYLMVDPTQYGKSVWYIDENKIGKQLSKNDNYSKTCNFMNLLFESKYIEFYRLSEEEAFVELIWYFILFDFSYKEIYYI